jgi:hypothetical protein
MNQRRRQYPPLWLAFLCAALLLFAPASQLAINAQSGDDAPPPPPPPTATPTPTPSPTPEPRPVGNICVNAFADLNGNGRQEAEEGFLAGVTLTVSRQNELIGQVISTGAAEAVCFANLEPGDYQVAQILPAGLEMTTLSNVTIALTAGEQMELRFGSRPRVEAPAPAPTTEPTATPAPPPNPAATDSLSISAYAGLIALSLGVVLLVVLIASLRRQKMGAAVGPDEE